MHIISQIILWLTIFATHATAKDSRPRFGLPPRDANASTGDALLPTGTGVNGLNISAYCDQQFSHYLSTYNPTGSYTTSTVTDYIGYDDTGEQTGDIVTQYYSTRTITFTEENYMAYQLGGAKPPCCHTCQMKAGTIEFYWWPGLANATATPSQYVTKPANNTSGPVTAIGTNGFIFTSPTVYMAFSSLYAKNFCGTVGQVWVNTTIGFHPSEISTVNPYTYTYTNYGIYTESGTTVTAINDVSGTRPPPSALQYTDLAQNCSTLSGYAYFPDDPQNDINGAFDRDPCHPVIALPTGLITMQQAWIDASCTVLDGYGAYDPPIALTAAASAAQPTLPAQTGSISTIISVTSTYIALPDGKPTTPPSSYSKSSSADSGDASETTWTVPRVTYNIPMIQVTESSLNVPEIVSTTSTKKSKPHIESTASPDVQRPASTTSVEVYTIIEVTTDRAGAPSVLTRTTEAVAQLVNTITVATTQAGGYVVMHTLLEGSHGAAGTAYTVLRDTTLANGITTAVPAVVVLGNGNHMGSQASAPLLIIAGTTYTANAALAFDMGGTTLSPGKTIVLGDTTVALAQNGASATINGQPVSLHMTAVEQQRATIKFGNQVATADTFGNYIVGPGTTLSVGGPSVTIDGTAYALKTDSAGDTLLVAGSATSTSSVDIAGYIMSAIGAMQSSSTSDATTQSTTIEEAGRALTAPPSSSSAAAAAAGISPVLCLILLMILILMMSTYGY